MGKLYVRVDDRLIHGQIVTSWCQTLGIRQIIAVDDELALNPVLQSIMTMGVPAQYSPQIVTVDNAKTLLEQGSDKNRLVIVRFCSVLELLRSQIKSAEHINLGNCSKLPDAVYKLARGAGWYIYLSHADADLLRIEAEEDGVTVFSQQMPQEKKIEWPAMKKEMGL
jgi:mannose/fructose/N-acetylgalactosamine-specific phosphotransferase system component IIB